MPPNNSISWDSLRPPLDCPLGPQALSAGLCPVSWEPVFHSALVHQVPVWPSAGPPASSFQSIILPRVTGPSKWPIWSHYSSVKTAQLTALDLAQPPLQQSAHHARLEALGCWWWPASTVLKPSHLLPSSQLATSYLSFHLAGCCVRTS